jgi:hypothetical protein
MRLRATATASPVAETTLLVPLPEASAKNHIIPPASQTICQQRLQMPPRTMPIRFVKRGAIHVALNSKTVLTVRATPTCSELYPTEIRYVIIWPEKERTVK